MRKGAEKSGVAPLEELVAKVDELTKKVATLEAEKAKLKEDNAKLASDNKQLAIEASNKSTGSEAEALKAKKELEKLRKELESEKSSHLKCEFRLKETAEELDRQQGIVQTLRKAASGGGDGFVPDKSLEAALLGVFAEFAVKVNELADESKGKIETEFEQTRIKAKEKAKAKAEAEKKKASEAEKAALVAELKALAEKAEKEL